MFRIGCGAGFSSDRLEPAVDLVREGALDVIVFECIGERTMAFGHRDRFRATHLRPSPAETAGTGNVGRRVGVIGASRVGRRLLELLRPFDLAVSLFDPYVDADEAAALGARSRSLKDLLSTSDIVSLHAPDIPETRHMLDRARLLAAELQILLALPVHHAANRIAFHRLELVLVLIAELVPLRDDRLHFGIRVFRSKGRQPIANRRSAGRAVDDAQRYADRGLDFAFSAN